MPTDGAHHDWDAEPHHVSVLSAGTWEDDEGAATVGLDYEYRRSEFLGLGAVVERAFGEIDATTVLGAFDLHLTHALVVQTGPGVEWIDGETKFVYRLGVLYEWMLDGYTLSPQIHYDATSGEDAVIAGVALGVAF
ncbi:MAG: hypothetical protein AAFU73_01570 [Planctomycetota bacterium]